MWNKGKTGATLNLPQNIKDLIAGGTLEVGYRYYDGSGNFLENPELKGGRSFKVEAVFGGDDAVRNVQFKTGDNTFGATSKSVDYTVPQGGAAAFLGNALSFFKSNWLWFLIGSLVLLFLIILIIVIAKRRKNKEEREEKKRQKEEEKERREEEKRRREEEREAAKAKQRAELELAKAKQEAELAKMKAEAAAAAGMAGVAVAAQPQQAHQPVQQQPQPQVQYIQQPAADPNVLAEIKAELAEIKARQNIEQQYRQSAAMQMPMAQPMMQMPMQMQQPMMPMMQQPSYGPMPAYGGQGGGMSDPVTFAEITRLKAENEAHMKSELDRARTESERAKAEAEIAKIRAESGQYAPRAQAAVPERSYAVQPIVQPQAEAPKGLSPEMLG
ncbi:MAG: hypothetical protein K2G38_00185, partial [Clostridia bacterium]|nr:hypothetical protein [Clostridia bacterium]